MSRQTSKANYALAAKQQLVGEIIGAVDRSLLRRHGPRLLTELERQLAAEEAGK